MGGPEVKTERDLSRVREHLRDYERLKLELAFLARRIALLVSRLADHQGYRKCEDLLSPLPRTDLRWQWLGSSAGARAR
jgi:hypothetical protein